MGLVSFVRKELVEANKRYTVIRDCLGGELTVKSKGTTYLPVPDNSDDAADRSKRYSAYKLRATFYGVTKRTLEGLCGQIFVRDPVIELPPEMKDLETDVDGGGVGLTQLSKSAVEYTLGYGRAGIFIDYPETAGAISQAELAKGDIRPTFKLYPAWEIINWRTMVRGARQILSLVVLEECYIAADDGFEAQERKQWRVLRLENDVYTVSIYKSTGINSAPTVVVPRDANGQPFNEIPFTFIGARNNDSVIDAVPMYDIAALNIAHYRNSADYEESTFMVGQPTAVLSGLTEDWVSNVLKGKILLGSRAAIPLPVGGAASLLQASPNSMPFEAMQHKEKQMVALGARLVEQRSVVRTASEANIDHTTESSVLASSAKNVAAALTLALGWAGRFMGVDASKARISLNTDFDIASMTPADRQQLILEWQSGALSWEEVRTNLRKSGIATMPDNEAREVIDAELAELVDKTAQNNTGTDNNGNTQQ